MLHCSGHLQMEVDLGFLIKSKYEKCILKICLACVMKSYVSLCQLGVCVRLFLFYFIIIMAEKVTQ